MRRASIRNLALKANTIQRGLWYLKNHFNTPLKKIAMIITIIKILIPSNRSSLFICFLSMVNLYKEDNYHRSIMYDLNLTNLSKEAIEEILNGSFVVIARDFDLQDQSLSELFEELQRAAIDLS